MIPATCRRQHLCLDYYNFRSPGSDLTEFNAVRFLKKSLNQIFLNFQIIMSSTSRDSSAGLTEQSALKEELNKKVC